MKYQAVLGRLVGHGSVVGVATKDFRKFQTGKYPFQNVIELNIQIQMKASVKNSTKFTNKISDS